MPISRSSVRSRNKKLAAGACVALAASGIVLLRAPRHSAAAPNASSQVNYTATGGGGPTRAEFTGPGVHGRIAIAQSAVQSGGDRALLAEIDVTADAQPAHAHGDQPVALAIVLDVSGSMQGEKIEQARRSVLELVEHMRAFDRIAFVTYSDGARVVQPLATVSEVRAHLRTVIPTVGIESGTNIPAGLAAGATALADAPQTFVRHIVLVSDGQDGSGVPLVSITEQVRGRAASGLTLSSLGIGADYDEHFLSGVADAGRGNYEFLAAGASMTAFLSRELDQATHTSVDRAVAVVTLPAGVRLRRALGTEAVGDAGELRLPIGSLASGDQRHIVLELGVAASDPGALGAIHAQLEYHTIADDRALRIDAGALAVRAVSTSEAADATRDVAVLADAQSATLAAGEVEAMNAWSRGDTAGASQIVQQNLGVLARLNQLVPSADRAAQAAAYQSDAVTINSVAPSSESGRSYGMRSRATNRAAQWHGSAF